MLLLVFALCLLFFSSVCNATGEEGEGGEGSSEGSRINATVISEVNGLPEDRQYVEVSIEVWCCSEKKKKKTITICPKIIERKTSEK